jgi:hypothetical protein
MVKRIWTLNEKNFFCKREKTNRKLKYLFHLRCKVHETAQKRVKVKHKVDMTN